MKNLNDNVHEYRANGLRQAVRLAGSDNGLPMVLLHGLMDTGASFAPLAEAIEATQPGSWRFIAPDWRGHGATEHVHGSYWFPDYLADLDALLDALAIDTPVVLVGHSMGGQVASQYAGARSQRVSHLITLDSLNVPDSNPADALRRYRRWLDAHREPPTGRVYPDLEAVTQRIARRYPELDATTLHTLARQWATPGDDGWRMRADPWHTVPFPYAFREAEAATLWRAVTAPVLCIDAADSPALRLVDAETMARRRACFDTVEHTLLADCGHMLHLQRPDAVAARLLAFTAAHPVTGRFAGS